MTLSHRLLEGLLWQAAGVQACVRSKTGTTRCMAFLGVPQPSRVIGCFNFLLYSQGDSFSPLFRGPRCVVSLPSPLFHSSELHCLTISQSTLVCLSLQSYRALQEGTALHTSPFEESLSFSTLSSNMTFPFVAIRSPTLRRDGSNRL